jgi:hypothetical protein
MLQNVTVNNILRSTTIVKPISFYCHASEDGPKRTKHNKAIHIIWYVVLDLLRWMVCCSSECCSSFLHLTVP